MYMFDFAVPPTFKKTNLPHEVKSKIEYVIWKFERGQNKLKITVEGRIQHENIKNNLSVNLVEQFLGEIDKICTNSSNVTFFEDNTLNINTAFF